MTNLPIGIGFTETITLGFILLVTIKWIFDYIKDKKQNDNYGKDITDIKIETSNCLTTINGNISELQKEVGELKSNLEIAKNEIIKILIKLGKK